MNSFWRETPDFIGWDTRKNDYDRDKTTVLLYDIAWLWACFLTRVYSPTELIFIFCFWIAWHIQYAGLAVFFGNGPCILYLYIMYLFKANKISVVIHISYLGSIECFLFIGIIFMYLWKWFCSQKKIFHSKHEWPSNLTLMVLLDS